MGRRKKPLATVNFGYAPQEVIDEFDTNFAGKTLAEALELTLQEESNIKGMYSYIKCEDQVNWVQQTTNDEIQENLQKSLFELDEFVSKFRLDSRAAAIEMLLFCNRVKKEPEPMTEEPVQWSVIEVNCFTDDINTLHNSIEDYANGMKSSDDIATINFSEMENMPDTKPKMLSIVTKQKRKYTRRSNPDDPTKVKKKRGRKKMNTGGLICTTCGKEFAFQSMLTVHERVHTGEKPYTCSVCGKSFAQKGSHDLHVTTHMDKQYTCEHCGLAFANNRGLKIHTRLHTGERPFVCEHCGAAYSRKSSLNEHVTKHTGEKPYSCSICGRAFRKACSKAKHERIHSDVKPFNCDQCGKGFTQKYNLQVHIRTHEKSEVRAEQRRIVLALRGAAQDT